MNKRMLALACALALLLSACGESAQPQPSEGAAEIWFAVGTGENGGPLADGGSAVAPEYRALPGEADPVEERMAALLSVEGAELLDCDLDKLRQAYAWGVRAVNLTWNHPNALSGTNAEERERGLSAQGRAFVQEMQRLGMLVDVSHLSDPGFWDVMEIAGKPIFASHSNARDVFFDTRNLTDAQFTAIIKNNGVAGLNLYAGFLGRAADLDTVTRHLEHFLALGGERNLSLGGDWDGCTVLPEGIEGIQDLDRLYEHLLRRNYHEELVRGIFYSNLMRVVSEVCNT